MTEKDKADDREHLSVRLNEAFERLEKQHEENQASAHTRAGSGHDTAEPPASIAGVLGVLLSLIAIGIASYAAWTVYLQTHKQSQLGNLSARVESVEQRVDGDQSQLHALGRQLNAISAKTAAAGSANSQKIANLQKQMAASISQLQASMATSGKDWLYAEVEYLLRLANQRVLMEGNVKGALVLFHDADNVLRQNAGITAYALREAIADNIAQLESVRQVDVDGIYLRLGALVNQVDQLQQRELKFKPRPVPPVPAPSAGSGFGDRLLALVERGAKRLASLVDFRRNSEHIQPILPPKEAYYLRQNLVLKLQMAQLALLRGDQAVYLSSLHGAQHWLEDHFDRQDTVTIAMDNELAKLAAIDVAQKVPDVSSSLKEVRKLMANFHEQPSRSDQAK